MNQLRRRTALGDVMRAIDSNDVARLSSLMASGLIDPNVRVAGAPLVVRAAKLGRAEIVAWLLDTGGSFIDAYDSMRRSACHHASREGHADVVRILLDRGADVSARDRHGLTPLYLAAFRNRKDIVNALVMSGASANDANGLCQIAAMGVAAVRMLLERQINVCKLRDRFGNTPCHIAVYRSAVTSADLLEVLISEIGIDANARSGRGRTCLHVAVELDRVEAAGWLIERGANVDAVDNNGRTATHDAAFYGHVSCALLLIAGGADANVRDCNGETALHHAMFCQHRARVLPLLVAGGADFDILDNNGRTPRMIASHNDVSPVTADDVKSARCLIERAQLGFVLRRAFQVCMGLHSLELDALCMCKILSFSCGPMANVVPFHRWWQVSTMMKHFQPALSISMSKQTVVMSGMNKNVLNV
jgi:ankyrin repeat protein